MSKIQVNPNATKTTKTTKRVKKPIVPMSCRAGSDYSMLVQSMRRRLETLETQAIFVTNINTRSLWYRYISSLPIEVQREHRCTACRQFIEAYGHLAFVDNGVLRSAIWPEVDHTAPETIYDPFLRVVHELMSEASIVTRYYTEKGVWGVGVTGIFKHFCVMAHRSAIWDSGQTASAHERMAAVAEDRATLHAYLKKEKRHFRQTINTVIQLLKSGQLSRSEKYVEWAEWLRRMHSMMKHENRFWLEAATAPVGWCCVKSSVLGTLIDLVAEGHPTGYIRTNWDKMMDPARYMRPTVASEGNIRQADKAFDALGLAPSLNRRMATMSDIETIWRPAGRTLGVKLVVPAFAELMRNADAYALSDSGSKPVEISWSKFRRSVLPCANKLELIVPTRGNFCGVMNSADPDTKSLFQWDNNVSVYGYVNGSRASEWGIPAMIGRSITGIMLMPHMWGDEDAHPHIGKGALLILDGAKDSNEVTLGIFPETLKSSLHRFRSTIEAVSRNGRALRHDHEIAGYLITERGSNGVIVRAECGNVVTSYRITLWE